MENKKEKVPGERKRREERMKCGKIKEERTELVCRMKKSKIEPTKRMEKDCKDCGESIMSWRKNVN